MKIHQTVLKETGHVALGVLIGDAVMLAIFFALKKLDHTVLFGALLGSAAAVGNFFVMGLAVQKAMADPDHARKIVQRSYTLRMIAMAGVMILGFVLPWFDKVAVVIPFLLPGLTIQLMRLFGAFKPQEKGGVENHES